MIPDTDCYSTSCQGNLEEIVVITTGTTTLMHIGSIYRLIVNADAVHINDQVCLEPFDEALTVTERTAPSIILQKVDPIILASVTMSEFDSTLILHLESRMTDPPRGLVQTDSSLVSLPPSETNMHVR